MNLHRLHCFTIVVEKGNLSKAAEFLNMTQPPLSILIKNLETELDAKLFERHKKRLILTDVGELLYIRAKELLASSENIMKEINEYNEGKIGNVRIGCSSSASITLVPNIVNNIHKKGMDITVDVREGNYSDILRDLRNNDIDIGLVRNIQQPEDLEVINLLKESLLLAVPPGHSLLTKDIVELKDLKHEKFLMQKTTYGQNISNFILEACRANHFQPEIIYWGTTSLPILFLVNRGVGISFIPESFQQIEHEMKLPPMINISSELLYSHLSLIVLKDRYRTSATNQVINIVEDISGKKSQH